MNANLIVLFMILLSLSLPAAEKSIAVSIKSDDWSFISNNRVICNVSVSAVQYSGDLGTKLRAPQIDAKGFSCYLNINNGEVSHAFEIDLAEGNSVSSVLINNSVLIERLDEKVKLKFAGVITKNGNDNGVIEVLMTKKMFESFESACEDAYSITVRMNKHWPNISESFVGAVKKE